ncbi:MAG: HEAT repeat domain-containing protein [Deltaproteobacteria bacterium]|nr:HEAT repeat domain-containing protein [Deltaproteobacteria bacterium]
MKRFSIASALCLALGRLAACDLSYEDEPMDPYESGEHSSACPGDPREAGFSLEQLCDCLHTGNWKQRAQAPREMAKLGDRRAVPVLIQALSDEEDLYVRCEIARGLAALGDRRAVEPLIAALRRTQRLSTFTGRVYLFAPNPKENRKVVCIKCLLESLGELGGPEAVGPLVEIIRSDERKYLAVGPLAEVGAPAVKPLIELLDNPDPLVRRYAAETLGKIGDPRAIAPLRALLEREKERVEQGDVSRSVYYQAGHALEKALGRVEEALDPAGPRPSRVDREARQAQEKRCAAWLSARPAPGGDRPRAIDRDVPIAEPQALSKRIRSLVRAAPVPGRDVPRWPCEVELEDGTRHTGIPVFTEIALLTGAGSPQRLPVQEILKIEVGHDGRAMVRTREGRLMGRLAPGRVTLLCEDRAVGFSLSDLRAMRLRELHRWAGLLEIETPEELGLAYLFTKQAGRDALADFFLWRLDRALAREPQREAGRLVHGFESPASAARLGPGLHLLACGSGRKGAIRTFLLRRDRLVPLHEIQLGSGPIANRPALLGVQAVFGTMRGKAGWPPGVVRLDLLSGEVIWRAAIGSVGQASVLVHGDRVFASSDGCWQDPESGELRDGEGSLFCLEASSGQVVWSLPIPEPESICARGHCAPVLDGALRLRLDHGGEIADLYVDPKSGMPVRVRPWLLRKDYQRFALDPAYPGRPRLRWQGLVCELREQAWPDNPRLGTLICAEQEGRGPSWKMGADTRQGYAFHPPMLLDGLLLVGRSLVDLRSEESEMEPGQGIGKPGESPAGEAASEQVQSIIRRADAQMSKEEREASVSAVRRALGLEGAAGRKKKLRDPRAPVARTRRRLGQGWMELVVSDPSALLMDELTETVLSEGSKARAELRRGIAHDDPAVVEASMRMLLALIRARPRTPLDLEDHRAIDRALQADAKRARKADVARYAWLLSRARSQAGLDSPLARSPEVHELDSVRFFAWRRRMGFEQAASRQQEDPLSEAREAALAVLRAGEPRKAGKLLERLDAALSRLPAPAGGRLRYRFPGAVGMRALGEDLHLMAAGSEQGAVHVYALRKGHILPLADHRPAASSIRSRPALVGTDAVVGLQGSPTGCNLVRLDLLGGKRRWEAPLGQVLYTSPIVHAGRVYVFTYPSSRRLSMPDGGLYCLGLDDGRIRWYLPILSMGKSPGLAWVDGKVRVRARVRTDERTMELHLVELLVDPDTGRLESEIRILAHEHPSDRQGLRSLEPFFPVRPRFEHRDLDCELREPSRREDRTGSLHCRSRDDPSQSWSAEADTYSSSTSDFEPFTLVGGLLFVGSTCVDLDAGR